MNLELKKDYKASKVPNENSDRCELLRFQSFKDCPIEIAVSATNLAKAGFYYCNNENECKCCTCGKVYNDWKVGDDPYLIHHLISPECSYIKHVEPVLENPVDVVEEKHSKDSKQNKMLKRLTCPSKFEIDEVSDCERFTKVVILAETIQTTNCREENRKENSNPELITGKNYSEQVLSAGTQSAKEDSYEQVDDGFKSKKLEKAESVCDDKQETLNDVDLFCLVLKRKLKGVVTKQFTDIMEGDCFVNFGKTDQENCFSRSCIEFFSKTIFSLKLKAKNKINELCDEIFKDMNYERIKTIYKHLFNLRSVFEQDLFTYAMHLPPNQELPNDTYLSDYGNPICHPTEEVESQVSRPIETHSMTAGGHQVCNPSNEDNRNSIVHVVIPPREECNEISETTQSSVRHLPRENLDTTSRQMNVPQTNLSKPVDDEFRNSLLLNEIKTSISSSAFNQFQETNVPNGTLNTVDNIDEVRPTERPRLEGEQRQSYLYTNSYKGVPIFRHNPPLYGYQDTCPVDPGIMIIMYQMYFQEHLQDLFSRSSCAIFSEDLPQLFQIFMENRTEEVRGKWASWINLQSNSFYDCEGNIMMPLFSHLLKFSYHLNCTNEACPCNGRSTVMGGMTLCCPRRRYFDRRELQNLIDVFSTERRHPCGERLEDTNDMTNSVRRCTGVCFIWRHVCSENQPPLVILNLVRSDFTRDHVGDLGGTVKIGAVEYYIGGVSFFANQHYTGRILLPHRNQRLFYDNLQGIQVMGLSALEPDGAILSLVYLFQK